MGSSRRQWEDILKLGQQIALFYELSFRRLETLDTKLLRSQQLVFQQVKKDAQKQRDRFGVNFKSLLSAMLSATGAGKDAHTIPGHNADHDQAADQLRNVLGDIHVKVEKALSRMEPGTPQLNAQSRDDSGHANSRTKRQILKEIKSVIQALEDSDEIASFERLCPPIMDSPLGVGHMEKVLRNHEILSKASSDLIKSIGEACSAHSKHTIWLSLDVSSDEFDSIRTAYFHISFECPGDPSCRTSFKVESKLDESVAPTRRRSRRLAKATQTPIYTQNLNTRVSKQKPRRRSSASTDNLNRHLQREFCLGHYQQRFGEKWCFSVAARFLGPTADHDILYPGSEWAVKEPPLPLRDLFTIYRESKGISAEEFAIQRRRIAMLLIQAFLRFSTTKWFQDSWNMENIFVYHVARDAQNPRYEPIVRKKIRPEKDDFLSISPAEQKQMRITLVIILAELAAADRRFEKFTRDLHSPEKLGTLREWCEDNGPIKKILSEQLGPDFARIVEYCVKEDYDERNIHEVLHKLLSITVWDNSNVIISS